VSEAASSRASFRTWTSGPATAIRSRLTGGGSTYATDVRAIFFAAMRLADGIVVLLTGILSYWARHGLVALPTAAWWEIVTGCLIAANALHFGKVYTFSSLQRRSWHLSKLTLAWTSSVLIMIALIFFTKEADYTSRAWMLIWAATSLAGLVVMRAGCGVWLGYLHRQGIFVFQVAVVGDEGPAERLAERIEAASDGDVHIVGIFRPGESAAEVTNDGHLLELVELSRKIRIDEVAVAVPCSTPTALDRILHILSVLPVDVKLCVDLPNPAPLLYGPINPPIVLLSSRPLAGWPMMIKRAMDIVLSLALLIVFAPFMLLAAVFIRLDSPGPVIFRQQRFGFNKQPITVLTFRTMYTSPEADPSVPQAKRNDPRVTRIGRFLRSSSIDELPQLMNVLRGDMSLVGPRPHAIAHDELYGRLIDGYLGRHLVKPGITGWAQANGYRGETDTIEKMQGRLEHDLFYIAHWSPLFDLRILVRTLVVGFRQVNAY
jgi:putative colanic acid biosysnthesis UDP-glucose lipid carrier transferase